MRLVGRGFYSRRIMRLVGRGFYSRRIFIKGIRRRRQQATSPKGGGFFKKAGGTKPLPTFLSAEGGMESMRSMVWNCSPRERMESALAAWHQRIALHPCALSVCLRLPPPPRVEASSKKAGGTKPLPTFLSAEGGMESMQSMVWNCSPRERMESALAVWHQRIALYIIRAQRGILIPRPKQRYFLHRRSANSSRCRRV